MSCEGISHLHAFLVSFSKSQLFTNGCKIAKTGHIHGCINLNKVVYMCWSLPRIGLLNCTCPVVGCLYIFMNNLRVQQMGILKTQL